MTLQLRDALAAKMRGALPPGRRGHYLFEEWQMIASCLLEGGPGEEEMAGAIKNSVFWPREETKEAYDGFFLAIAKLLREHVVWVR